MCQSDGEPKKANDIVPIWKPGSRLKKSQYFSSCPKAEEKIMSQLKRQPDRRHSPLLARRSTFIVYSDLQLIGWGPPTLRTAICFPQSINSNINLIWKHSHRPTKDSVYHVWTPHGPVKLAHKINHHYNYGCKCCPMFQRYIHLFSDEL